MLESKMICWLVGLCCILASRVDAQNREEIPELLADFEFPEFTCRFSGQFPYIVSVRDRTPQKEHVCGGVVIAENAVLTAAHCVDPRTSKKATTTPDVHIGGVNSDEPIQVRRTVVAIPHDDWTGTTEDGNDLVILKLDKKTCVSPIPNLGAKGPNNRESLVFLGYGRTAIGGSFSFVLQSGVFNSLNVTHCNDRYNINPDLGKRDLCVRGETAVGVCSGDDGGPLIYQPTLTEFRDVLVGIASYASAECTDTEGAAIFMNIRKYRKWIKRTLKSERFLEA